MGRCYEWVVRGLGEVSEMGSKFESILIAGSGCWLNVRRVCVIFVVCLSVFCGGSGLDAAENERAETVSQPVGSSGLQVQCSDLGVVDCQQLKGKVEKSAEGLAADLPELKNRLTELVSELERLAADNGEKGAKQREELSAERTALQVRIKYLELANASWQAAVDSCEKGENLKRQLVEFQKSITSESVEFSAGDVAAMEAQLVQLKSVRDVLDSAEQSRGQRLAEIGELLAGEASAVTAEFEGERTGFEGERTGFKAERTGLEAERTGLLAERKAACYKLFTVNAEESLITAKLQHAGKDVGAVAASGDKEDDKGAESDQADALNKQKLAADLEAEARDRLGFVRQRLSELEQETSVEGLDEVRKGALSREAELLRRVEEYEQRRLLEAELQARAAKEKTAIAQVKGRVGEQLRQAEELAGSSKKMLPEDRKEKAASYREQAEKTLKEAEKLDADANIKAEEVKPLQQLLPSIDAIEQALHERLENTGSFLDYEEFSRHVREMREQLDLERRQIDLMVVTTENVAFSMKAQAILLKELAGLYNRCGDILDPPVPTFWQRQRKIVNAGKILIGVVALTYILKILIWLLNRLLGCLNSFCSGTQFSVKRAGTLLSFAGSIIKLFAWVAAVVMVLNEFGIDPKASGGAIGLIGLIMAGMFQQIVVDFVKGLDIVAGRHFNVGDFVEVAGKFGHVVDFNVKHTRIRTLSGQQINIPNSQCVPSRRFPDGYVNNYIDLTLKDGSQEELAERLLEEVCEDLNQRIEPIREEPRRAWRFTNGKGRVVLRYRVRVLPGCDWVVKDHFVPKAKAALAVGGVELAGEPDTFFINSIDTFRKLFSRQLSEDEIVREATKPPEPIAEAESNLEDSNRE